MRLVVTAVFPPEPVVSASLSRDLAEELSICGPVVVISPEPTRPYGFVFPDVQNGETIYEHKVLASYTNAKSSFLGRIKESYSFGRATASYLMENRDRVKVLYVNTWPLLAQYFIVKYAKKYNIPVVLHVQDIYPESLGIKLGFLGPLLNFVLRPLDSWILKNSSKIIAISDKMKAYLVSSRSIESSSVEVVMNWQDEKPFLETGLVSSSNHKHNKFTFMYLGNIGPVAGCDLLIEAFATFNNANCKLIIAGSGSMKNSLIDRVNSRNIKNIEFLVVPDGAVPQIQALADVLLLPIKKGAASSSIPSKLPAYMFSGKPIIASVDRESDTANVVSNSGCGWILEPENSFALVETMQLTYQMPKNQLIIMGMNGRDYALKHFSRKNNLQKLVNIVEELIE